MITVIDYEVGNLKSIQNMLRRIGVDSEVTSDVRRLGNAKKLILPGVGAFDYGMKNLKELGLIAALQKKAIFERVPILGICLGFQLFTLSSEEGNEPGLGWLDARTVKFKFNSTPTPPKIPNMGWSDTRRGKESRLFRGLEGEARFYFVHSYHVVPNDREHVIATAEYGIPFVAAAERGNIVGVQFHPEKSHRFGMRLLQNFVELYE